MKKSFILFALFSSTLSAAAVNKVVIGKDERSFSRDHRVARMGRSDIDRGGCSAALIGKTCMISAGHCSKTLAVAEFNVPQGARLSGIRDAKSYDTYKMEPGSLVFQDYGIADEDWAVFRLKRHAPLNRLQLWWIGKRQGAVARARYAQFNQGYYPGDIQPHFDVSFEPIVPGTAISITGFGTDSDSKKQNMSEQTASGIVTMLGRNRSEIFYHNVDTDHGSSGSGVLDTTAQKIIGVHTFQACTVSGNNCRNGGTSIATTPDFARAIRECLEWEENHLNR